MASWLLTFQDRIDRRDQIAKRGAVDAVVVGQGRCPRQKYELEIDVGPVQAFEDFKNVEGGRRTDRVRIGPIDEIPPLRRILGVAVCGGGCRLDGGM